MNLLDFPLAWVEAGLGPGPGLSALRVRTWQAEGEIDRSKLISFRGTYYGYLTIEEYR